MNSEEAYISRLLVSDTLTFTRYFFKARSGVRFMVGDCHKEVAAALDDVLRGRCKRLIINIPPRYGKTELVSRSFIAMGLALNPRANFLHLSYSATLAEENSVAVKDIIRTQRYAELFPATRIKPGEDTRARWATTVGGGVYATSTLGQVTGFGAGVMSGKGFGGAIVIDDPIKPEDALNVNARTAVNRRFETTIRSRVNSTDTPIVVIMQRLHEDDLTGYLTKTEPNVWRVLRLPAIREDGTPLWEAKHTLSDLCALRDVNPYVFATQYQQQPTPIEGLLYNAEAWKEYIDTPTDIRAAVKNYTDTADGGGDYLVSINYIETATACYITDVICTKDAMEDTEGRVATMLQRGGVEEANIESNNGGKGFARNVERKLRENGELNTRVSWFHQSANKEARIFNGAASVQNVIRWPQGWRERWPQAAAMLDGYLREGKNAHDDVPDVLTGIMEKMAAASFRTYDGERDGEEVSVVCASAGQAVFVSGIVADGCYYVRRCGVCDEAEEFSGRILFAAGTEEVRRYNALRDGGREVYGCAMPSASDEERWSTSRDFVFWRDAEPLHAAFARRSAERETLESKAVTLIASFVARS